MAYSVNVRTLAEFAFEGGDLAVDFSAVERMREGMEGHLTLQRQLDETWRTEEPQSIDMHVHDIDIRVQGRVDAVRRAGDSLTIEEIKTTRRNPAYIGADEFPVHWAQAEIYAAIICKKEGFASAEVALIYYNINGSRNRMSRTYSAARLWRLLNEYLAPYARWLMAMEEWRGKFMPSVAEMRFPFDNYRDGQRQMAANAYVAARDHRRVMIEAPTGIGKTAAALFGA
ncbi:MAG: PD-(D/E)XK nuclease family protein, partial [Clostridia bacterium]|nr:PD-(D/E)XK nuclease family protein [Clostridia bacterium]